VYWTGLIVGNAATSLIPRQFEHGTEAVPGELSRTALPGSASTLEWLRLLDSRMASAAR